MPDSSLYIITPGALNITALIFLLIMVSKRSAMSPRRTKAFYAATVITIVTIASELVTTVLVGPGKGYAGLNRVCNALGFSLSVFLPYVFVEMFDEKYSSWHSLAYVIPSIVTVLSTLSIWQGLIFSVSDQNEYSRGPLFGVYITAYVIGFVLILISNIIQRRSLRKGDWRFLSLLYIFLISGTSVQVLHPGVLTTWHTVTIVLVVYYIFQCEIQFRIDQVTGLLNRQAFTKRMEELSKSKKAGVVLMDIDFFKNVNDKYGHAMGDICLHTMGEIIKESFGQYGQCFRIGGDEFCVLFQEENCRHIEERINDAMARIIAARSKNPALPLISYGYSVYERDSGKSINDSFSEADREMYRCKRKRNPVKDVLN